MSTDQPPNWPEHQGEPWRDPAAAQPDQPPQPQQWAGAPWQSPPQPQPQVPPQASPTYDTDATQQFWPNANEPAAQPPVPPQPPQPPAQHWTPQQQPTAAYPQAAAPQTAYPQAAYPQTAYPPVSGVPVSGPQQWTPQPAPVPPVSGAPVSGSVPPPAPQWTPQQPTAAYPQAAAPQAAYPPVSGVPVSGSAPPQWTPQPASFPPVSGAPVSGSLPPPVGNQYQAGRPAWNTDPLAQSDNPATWQPRIVPSPPPARGKLWLGLLVGLVAGAAVAGTSAYFLKPEKTVTVTVTTPAPTPSRTLSVYEQSRLAINKPKLAGDLTTLAEPWLPYLGGCLSNLDSGGPQLGKGHLTRIGCLYSGVAVFFVVYQSPAGRDEDRAVHVQANSDATAIAPGVTAPARKPGGGSKVQGNYIEYAYRNPGNDIICGLWWDRDDNVSSLTLEAPCGREFGGKWDSLRDLWQTFS